MSQPIYIVHRRTSISKIREKYGSVAIVDTTSKAPGDYQKLSPFYPHGGIPIPKSPGFFSMSVEGLWQGLKVFESTGVDQDSFMNTSMKNLKRTVRKNGPCLGHAYGLSQETEALLGYREAREKIYLPAFLWVLENKLQPLTNELKSLLKLRTLVLLDYNTNEELDDLSKPLSHAGLIKAYLQDLWPAQTNSPSE